MTFEGFPVAALDFYDDLEIENTKEFWEAHKATYDEAVKAPMVALTDALAQEFGDAKVFRPYRDVWFSSRMTFDDPNKPASSTRGLRVVGGNF
ncbi:DUF2461 family protein [Nocardioides montaniterrae]